MSKILAFGFWEFWGRLIAWFAVALSFWVMVRARLLKAGAVCLLVACVMAYGLAFLRGLSVLTGINFVK